MKFTSVGHLYPLVQQVVPEGTEKIIVGSYLKGGALVRHIFASRFVFPHRTATLARENTHDAVRRTYVWVTAAHMQTTILERSLQT